VLRTAAKWGLGLGIATFVWTIVVHLLGFYTHRIAHAATVDRVVIVLPAVFVFAAVLERHRLAEPRLSFVGGVATGTLTGLIAAPVTVAAIAFYHAFINPEWLSILVAHERSLLEAAGASAEAIATRVAQLQQRAEGPRHLVNGVVGGTMMGLVLSLVLTPVVRLLPRGR